MTHALPLPSTPHVWSGSLGYLSCYTCTASASPVQCPADPAVSVWDSHPVAGKESTPGFLFICVLVYFFPGMKQWLRGKGREEGWGGKAQKRSCGGPKIGRRNVSIIATAFQPHSSSWAPLGWKVCVTLIMPWSLWLCSSWNFQQKKKNVVSITVSLRDLYWVWDH